MTDSGPVHDYSLCGWKTSSAIELPELTPWQGGGEESADLVIAKGLVPDRLDDIAFETPALQLGAEGRARFAIDDVGVFLVEAGCRITVMPMPNADPRAVRLFLLGTPFGILCHQRGLTPFHAAGVEIDGEAVLLAGASGIGKSTLSYAFLKRGFRLLSDDVTPVRVIDGGVEALPAIRRVRLWQDSADAAGMDVTRLERCRDGLDKYCATAFDGFASEPVPVRALITLHRIPPHGEEIGFHQLRGGDAVEAAGRQIYRARSFSATHGKIGALARVTRVTAAIPQHFAMFRPLRFEDLNRHVDIIVEAVRAAR